MHKSRKPEFVEVEQNRVISTKGIMSITQMVDGTIRVRYISGYAEDITSLSMPELLTKMGRMPDAQSSADRTRPPGVR